MCVCERVKEVKWGKKKNMVQRNGCLISSNQITGIHSVKELQLVAGGCTGHSKAIRGQEVCVVSMGLEWERGGGGSGGRGEGWGGFEDANAGGLSGFTECSVTGRTGRTAEGEGTLRAFKIRVDGHRAVVGLDRAERRRGSWEKG